MQPKCELRAAVAMPGLANRSHREPSTPHSALAPYPRQARFQPCLRWPGIEWRDIESRSDQEPACWPAGGQRCRRPAISFRIDSQNGFRFATKLLVRCTHLAKLLKNTGPELAASPGEVIRHVSSRQLILRGERRVGRSRVGFVIEIVVVKDLEVN